jgi:hypothetical protein
MTEPQPTTLAARTGTALRLAKGESLKIVNTHGTQVVDFWAFNAEDLNEWMSMPKTRNACRKLTPAVGESFVTTLRRPILTLDEDTSPGVHDTLIPACDAIRYEELGYKDHANCADNMAIGLKELGIEPTRPHVTLRTPFILLAAKPNELTVSVWLIAAIPPARRRGPLLDCNADILARRRSGPLLTLNSHSPLFCVARYLRKRDSENGESRSERSPKAHFARHSPTAGPSLKPCPLEPAAKKRPSAPGT